MNNSELSEFHGTITIKVNAVINRWRLNRGGAELEKKMNYTQRIKSAREAVITIFCRITVAVNLIAAAADIFEKLYFFVLIIEVYVYSFGLCA